MARGTLLADGPAILDYIGDTARDGGILAHIRFGTRVLTAAFHDGRMVGHGTSSGTLTCNFLYACTGYYDYGPATSRSFPARTTSRVASCTRSSGPPTSTTPVNASSSSAAAPPP